MNIAFCGHKDFIASNDIEAKIIEMLLMYARKEREVCCFNGGYVHLIALWHTVLIRQRKKPAISKIA